MLDPHAATDCSGCPLELANPEVVDRRSVLSKGMLAAVAAVLSAPLVATACAPSVSTASSPAKSQLGAWMIRVRPEDFPALEKVGGIARIDGESDKPVAVVKTSDGYAAFSMRCTHAGVTVDIVDGGFLCPGHKAQYAADGRWVGGHAAKNLKSLETSLQDGVLTIAG